MNHATRLEELIEGYTLGQLDDDALRELETLLESDRAARDRLRLSLKVDAHLQEASAELEPTAKSGRTVPFSPATGANRWAVPALSVAALLLLAALIAVLATGRGPGPGTPSLAEEAVPSPPETIPSSPTPPAAVATVSLVQGQGLRDQADVAVLAGRKLVEGDRLSMAEGMVEIVFRNGVHTVARAPLTLEVLGEKRIRCEKGELKLHVPPQGIGFVVETLDREITDLGTSFVVSTGPRGSRVFVLDGQVATAAANGSQQQLLVEGDLVEYGPDRAPQVRSRSRSTLPELPLASVSSDTTPGLRGSVFVYPDDPSVPTDQEDWDMIGQRALPWVASGFRDLGELAALERPVALPFRGIAGAYRQFPTRAGLHPYAVEQGWLAWYRGDVIALEPGRYRFWGYADNHLLVAVDGEAVFEGSRFDSAFFQSEEGFRQHHPAWPCLNATYSIASGRWVEIGTEPVRLDILFGEITGTATSALLLIEREGATYDPTFWGQPRFPVFILNRPDEDQRRTFETLGKHLEEKLHGAFSIPDTPLLRVAPSP